MDWWLWLVGLALLFLLLMGLTVAGLVWQVRKRPERIVGWLGKFPRLKEALTRQAARAVSKDASLFEAAIENHPQAELLRKRLPQLSEQERADLLTNPEALNASLAPDPAQRAKKDPKTRKKHKDVRKARKRNRRP
jgi:hypothetical protein